MLANQLFKRKNLVILIALVILIIPTFWRMLRPGIFSMQDFHIFRLFEYHKCVLDLQIPCRFSPDASFEYGQPIFNFYGQLSYAFGEVFLFLGASHIDTLKILFALSLILSGLSMFLLSKQMWKSNLAALVSALVYVYAPYRAVDVYVRGALPEAFAFIFFPLIIYFLNRFISNQRQRDLVFFSLTLAGLILTHNISALMFTIFLVIWGVFVIVKNRAWKVIPKLLVSCLLILGLVSFYILPVIGESSYTSLNATTQGYFQYINHYVTLNQLLFSRFWGYGGSGFGDQDGLSLSVGHLQWILPIIGVLLLLVLRKWREYSGALVLFGLGWLFLFLTHNKSTPIWQLISPFHYIQFPWRFLGMAVFSFALGSGVIITLIRQNFWQKMAVIIICVMVIGLNFGFFFEDLWFKIDDRAQFSGKNYEQLISASIEDYWPRYGAHVPSKIAPKDPLVTEGVGSSKPVSKSTNQAKYNVDIRSKQALVTIPVVYFPGWVGFVDGKPTSIFPEPDLGAITFQVPQGFHTVSVKFTDTPVRVIGNLISFLTIFLFCLIFFKYELIKKYYEKVFKR